jgi:hypothetical protein
MATARFPKATEKKVCPVLECKAVCGPKKHSVTRHLKRHHPEEQVALRIHLASK